MSLELAAAEGAGKLVWGFLKPFIWFIVCAAVGFGACEIYEHRGKTPAPFSWVLGQSLRYQRDQAIASIPAKVAAARQAGANVQAAADAPQFDKWKAALARCQGADQAETAKESAALAKAATFATTQSSVAYRIGRASCGETDHAQNPGPPGVGSAVAAGVRNTPPGPDFRALFAAGSYTPASEHPLSGGGVDPTTG